MHLEPAADERSTITCSGFQATQRREWGEIVRNIRFRREVHVDRVQADFPEGAE